MSKLKTALPRAGGNLTAAGLTLPGRLSDVSATLEPGRITAIVGPNGAGKSSLLACLAGLLEPASGMASLGDTALARLHPRARARAIGYLPQSAQVAWDLDVAALVALGRLPWRTSASDDARAIASALAAMDLADFAHRRIGRLSGGERARALLARVLAGEPRWLLADEPAANLDLAHSAALFARLRGFASAGVGGGMGVVVVLHDLAQAMNHADCVVVLSNGALVADGPPEDALAEATITEVWGVRARWLGEAGVRALAVG